MNPNLKSILTSNPNPDIEKIDVTNREDLERFFKVRIPGSSNRLFIPNH